MTARSTPSSSHGTFVALLRGINVGGKNLLPMRDLVAMFERAGCAEVRHYIQSGNVVFRAAGALAARISQVIAGDIERTFRLSVPVVLRSGKELTAVAKGNPHIADGADPAACHVMFLADAPSKKQCAALDPARSPGDSFVAKGREVYLLCPNGVARTKLTNAYFDSALGTTSTARNWKTVLKLVEMAGE
jgi:uncharacterized protein (DUF1697 family)